MSSEDQPKPGLRERKKIKTRETIQLHALRLFRKFGYTATTIEQIADAAEISPSTFFRYFPTKEALVLEDDYDPLLIHAFQAQPPELSPIRAFREAVKTGFAEIPEKAREALRERMELASSVPELRAASLNQMAETLRMISEVVSERIGRDPGDFHVLTFAGSVIGAFMAVQIYCAQHPEANYVQAMDDALAHLEEGLPLPFAKK